MTTESPSRGLDGEVRIGKPLTYGAYPPPLAGVPPRPRAATCTHPGCLDPGFAHYDGLDRTFTPGPCERHFKRTYWP